MLFELAKRSGRVVADFPVAAGNNALTLTLAFEAPARRVGLVFSIEQLDGAERFLLGAVDLADVRLTDRSGAPVASLSWTFREQLLRSDACRQEWATTRDYEFRGRSYKHLALFAMQRLTLETDAELTYSVDVVAADRPFPVRTLPVIGGR